MPINSEKPAPPEEWECCGSGCSPCVWDNYYNELDAWNDSQKDTSEKAAQ